MLIGRKLTNCFKISYSVLSRGWYCRRMRFSDIILMILESKILIFTFFHTFFHILFHSFNIFRKLKIVIFYSFNLLDNLINLLPSWILLDMFRNTLLLNPDFLFYLYRCYILIIFPLL
jgi:hypothetical protein